jgi:hypothetical protein
VTPFASEWFAAMREGVAEIAFDRVASSRLNFTTEATRWHLVIDSGRVMRFDVGHVDDPDAELQWSQADATAIISRVHRGDDALRRTTVVTAVGDGCYVGPPAPLNLLCRPELAELPLVWGATVTVQYRYRNGPFGDVNYALSFVDGRCVDESLGVVADATVNVEASYRAMALVRAGEMTILEALEGGSVDGPVGALGVLAGISEDPRFHSAELATGRHAIALAALGDLDADERYQHLISELVTVTDA